MFEEAKKAGPRQRRARTRVLHTAYGVRMAGEPEHLRRQGGSMWREAVHYPDEYLWLLLVGTLDILCTSVILALGGREVNPIANHVLQLAGMPGMVFLKFAAVALVVCICEYIGRHRPAVARRLARFAVGVSLVPVVLALLQLFVHFYAPITP